MVGQPFGKGGRDQGIPGRGGGVGRGMGEAEGGVSLDSRVGSEAPQARVRAFPSHVG